jgi:hypothetical protein
MNVKKESSKSLVHFDIDENIAILIPDVTGVIKSEAGWNEISYYGKDGKEYYLRFQQGLKGK